MKKSTEKGNFYLVKGIVDHFLHVLILLIYDYKMIKKKILTTKIYIICI